MAKIKADALMREFQRMYEQKWSYVKGAAKEGCVDCSGAFVYAYKKLGGPVIDHGSNSIFRKFVDLSELSKTPYPGWAAFKQRFDAGEPKKYFEDGYGNLYHIGLVSEDGKHVYNAKSSACGFSLDSAVGFQLFAPLKAVEYNLTTREESGMELIFTYGTATVNTKKDPLAIRAGRGSDYSKLGSVPKGGTVALLESAPVNGWWYVISGDVKGYCSGEYLETSSGGTSSVASGDTFPKGEGIASSELADGNGSAAQRDCVTVVLNMHDAMALYSALAKGIMNAGGESID